MEPITRLLPLFLAALLALGQEQDPGQDDGPKPPKPPSFGPPEAAPDLLASDGKPVEPGRIPEDTSDKARARWERWIASTRGAESVEPIRSFDLEFDLTHRREGGTNSVRAQFTFLDEAGGYIRAFIDKSKRVKLRGPDGDWLIEANGDRTSLKGRQNKRDREELIEWISIARNFITLTRPAELRIVGLTARGTWPLDLEDVSPGSWKRKTLRLKGLSKIQMPSPEAAQEAYELEWLEVRSPDFRLYQSVQTGVKTPVYRALLGLDPESGDLRMAILNEDDDGTIVLESMLFVDLKKWDELSGYRVPANFDIYRPDFGLSPWAFERRPGADLYLRRGGQLNPELSADAFRK